MRDASARRPPTGSTMRTKPPASPRHKLSHTVRMLAPVNAPTAPTPLAFTQPTSASASRPWSRHELALRAVQAWQRRAHVEGQQLARATMQGFHAHLQALPACTASSLLARSAQRILQPHLSRRAHVLAALLDGVSSHPLAHAWTASTHRTAGEIAALIGAIEADHGWLGDLNTGYRTPRAGWLAVCRVASWRREPSDLDADTPRAIPLHDAALAKQLWLSCQIEALLWNDAARMHAALVTIATRCDVHGPSMPAKSPRLCITPSGTASERQGELQ